MNGVPWFRASKNSGYVWHNGAQVRLATGKENKGQRPTGPLFLNSNRVRCTQWAWAQLFGARGAGRVWEGVVSRTTGGTDTPPMPSQQASTMQ